MNEQAKLPVPSIDSHIWRDYTPDMAYQEALQDMLKAGYHLPEQTDIRETIEKAPILKSYIVSDKNPWLDGEEILKKLREVKPEGFDWINPYVEFPTLEQQRDADHEYYLALRLKVLSDEDGLCCPRCCGIFHDKDIEEHPEDYWVCPLCKIIEHRSCRGDISDMPLGVIKDIIELRKELKQKLVEQIAYKPTDHEGHKCLRAKMRTCQDILNLIIKTKQQ